MIYDAAKEKGGMFYVCHTDTPSAAIAGTYRKEKKDALKLAAEYEGISYKEYLKLRKKINQYNV